MRAETTSGSSQRSKPSDSRRPRSITARERSRSVKTVGLVTALHKRKALGTARKLLSYLEARGVSVSLLPECASRLRRPELSRSLSEIAECNLCVVLGGDGSVLATARETALTGALVLPVDVGGFGFLNHTPLTDLERTVDEVLRGECAVEERRMLRAFVWRQGQEVASSLGLNDAVIRRGLFPRPMTLQAFAGDEYVGCYVADGMIVATSTGSTAYSLSAGGPLVHPGVEAFLLTPICAHTLFARTLVLPMEETVRLVVDWPEQRESGVLLTVDGQVDIPLQAGDTVEVRQGDQRMRAVRTSGNGFYSRVRSKLMWGGEWQRRETGPGRA